LKTLSEIRRNIVAALLLICLAAAYGSQAQKIPGSSLIGKGIGAGAVPTALAIALASFSVLLILQSLLAWRRLLRDPELREAEPDHVEERRRHGRAFGMLAIGIGFALSLGTLGYAPSIALLMLATAWYNGLRPSKQLFFFALGGATVCYLIFVQILHIPMPSGSIWRALFTGLFW
jgi:hypothetical protein